MGVVDVGRIVCCEKLKVPIGKTSLAVAANVAVAMTFGIVMGGSLTVMHAAMYSGFKYLVRAVTIAATVGSASSAQLTHACKLAATALVQKHATDVQVCTCDVNIRSARGTIEERTYC